MVIKRDNNSLWGKGETEHFNQLDPITLLDQIDSLGLRTTGRCLALNSLENRVYEVEIENPNAKTQSDHFVIAKFYRPGRWSKEQIQEEHDYLFDLKEAEIPVIAPLKFEEKSLFQTEESKGGLFYCIYPKRGGRNPDELNDEMCRDLGRLLGRIHLLGQKRKFNHRLALTPQSYGHSNLESLLDMNFIPESFKKTYQQIASQFLNLITPHFKNIETQRIHGDCHWGNILHSETEGFFFIDFDDVVQGPVVQDLWLLMPGRDQEAKQRRSLFLESYSYWNDFPHSQLKLIEALRGLRYLHFDNWIAKRWNDPSFPNAFPLYETERYWGERINDLREQISFCEEAFQTSYY